MSAFCNSSSVVKMVLDRCLRRCRKTCWPLDLGTGDDCPYYPAPSRSDPFPTHRADARPEDLEAVAIHGRKPGERRLCQCWVTLLHTATIAATCTHLARSKEDVPPTDRSLVAARAQRPKRPSSKATTLFSGDCWIKVPKFFKGGLLLCTGFLLSSAPGLPQADDVF
jgi:hypothetical protein